MISHILSEKVFHTLKDYVSVSSQFTPAVVHTADNSTVLPRVELQELANTQSVRDGNGMISHSLIQIEIVIHTKDMVENEKEASANEIAMELADLCDNVCTLGFGMKRESWKPSVDEKDAHYCLNIVYKAIQDDMRQVYY